ncbi:MAG: hypothetical protein ACYC6A_12220 [Armatimonadota bacterium]
MVLPDERTNTEPLVVNQVRTFVDEQTGRTIRQLTDLPHGAHLGYFRMFRQLPDGRMLAWARHEHGSAIVIDPESGDLKLIPHRFRSLKFREADGRNWYLRHKDPEARYDKKTKHAHQLWHIDLPNGEPVFDMDVSEDLPGVVEDITIDGKHLILRHTEQDLTEYPIPTTKDVESINHYFSRPRRGELWVYRIADGQCWKVMETEGISPLHVDTSPADPELIRYALDMPDAQGQRVWTIRLDGSDQHLIRKQEFGEMITHEFWWSDPSYIGFTYQDRRNDPTLMTHHWAEYAYALTRLGIANLAGDQVYLSDPINSYHSHLYRSECGTLVSGEGTDGHSFVYAARFDMRDTKLQMIPLATIHTEYVPFRGQGVDCNFSADSKWLIYADKLDPEKPHQLFAVEVDL